MTDFDRLVADLTRKALRFGWWCLGFTLMNLVRLALGMVVHTGLACLLGFVVPLFPRAWQILPALGFAATYTPLALMSAYWLHERLAAVMERVFGEV